MELFLESIVGVISLLVGIGFIILVVCICFTIKESEYLQRLLSVIFVLFLVSLGVHEEDAKTISFGSLYLLFMCAFWLFTDERESGLADCDTYWLFD